MTRYRIFLLFLSVVTMCTSPLASPCTTFVLRQGNRLVFGRNLDWITGTGLVMVNQRKLAKRALVDPAERPIEWVSRFGSITFDQVGRDLPYGGMNEAGLVVENMTLDRTVYPSRDGRCAIGACQWIQFQLDNYSTIEQVLSSDTLLRIVDANSKFHYFICDRFGHAAVIEFLDGKMVYHAGEALPVQALANSTYEESLKCFENRTDTLTDRSLYNFCCAAQEIHHADSLNGDSLVEEAFRTLKKVSQGVFTKWSIAYDITRMRLYVKVFETPTIVGQQKIFFRQSEAAKTMIVDLTGCDFSCSAPAKVLDLECNREGMVNAYFVEYSTAINHEFISKAFTFFKNWGAGIDVNESDLAYLARYPESFKCTE